MFLEYGRLLGWDSGGPISLDFIINIGLILGGGLLLSVVGFKIKGIWGALVFLLIGAIIFCYAKGLLRF